MGDPLSVASGVVGLLNTAGLVFSLTYKFVKAAGGAASTIKTLADEIQTLKDILHNLSPVASKLETNPTTSVFRLQHVISCQDVLLKIDSRIREADPSNSGDNKARAFVKKLKWPFSSEETMDLIEEVTRHQRLITVALSADTITNLQQISSDQDDLRKAIEGIWEKIEKRQKLEEQIALQDERQNVFRFFGTVDPTTNHETNKSLRHRQTGFWLLSHEKFLAWTRNVRSRLWLSGIPGAGKTILASVVIEKMLEQSTPEKAAAYFYCDYKDEQSQKLSNILGTIACQIARQDPSDHSYNLLRVYYKTCHPIDRPTSNPKAVELLDIIRDMSSLFDEISIVVDALDECGCDQGEVVEALASLNENALSNIRTAFLSRDEPEIGSILEDFTHLPIAAHYDDLKIYVAEEIDSRVRKQKLRIRNPGLKNEIIETLVNGADGMFRWVTCQLDYLSMLPHDRARREALRSLPPDLNSTYDRILEHVAHNPPITQMIVRDTLLWTMYATEPLAIGALCEALSVDGSTTTLDPESKPGEQDILKYCSSLLRKVPGGKHLELAHFTVQQYLCSDALKKNQNLTHFYMDQQSCTAYLAKVCLRYLKWDGFSRTPPRDYEEWRDFNHAHPFRSHATTEWYFYASQHQDDPEIRDMIQKLLDPLKPVYFVDWAQNLAATALDTKRRLDSRTDFFTALSTVTTKGIIAVTLGSILLISTACYLLRPQHLQPPLLSLP